MEVADIRSKREEEKTKLVKQKQDQQFINSADPLRRLKQERAEFEIKKNRDHQVKVAKEMREEEKREGQFWDELMLRKCVEQGEREAIRENERAMKNREIKLFLDEQMEEKAMEVREQRKKDPNLMNKLMEDAKQEERERYEWKVGKQREMKFLLDKSLELKSRRIAEEKSEESEFERVILEDGRVSEGREKERQCQRKRELAREAALYLKYLRKDEEEQREKEGQIMSYVRQREEEISEAARQKRLAEERRRQNIYDAIQEFRAHQSQMKELDVERQLREKEDARNVLCEDLKRLEDEREAELQKAREGKERRKGEILAQMAHNAALKREKEGRRQSEIAEMELAEREYADKMKRFIEREAN